MKKKITSAFCFPGELNMQQRMSEPSQLHLIYDLSAVLIHKGTAVNSGHYIALIKDENTGQWWEFDDEHVSNLGHHPFGEGSSTSGSKGVHSEPVVCPSVTERVEGANVNHVDLHLPFSKHSNGSNVERFTSNDAYMLMYNLRRDNEDSKKKHVVRDINNMGIESDVIFLNDIFLPSHLGKEIKESNTSYLDACEQFKLKKGRELDCITERKQEVRSLLSEAPVPSLEVPFYWISSDWLRQWADKISSPTLDNTSIQCLHGKVPASKVGSMKRISSKAWNKLFSKYNGGPALTNDDYCLSCLIDVARTVVCADSYRVRRKSMKGLADDVLSGKFVDGTYYVSKSWLQQWTKRKNLDAPSEADGGPTTSIMCPHGQLMPEKASGAKRLLVPEILWRFIYEDAMKVKPDDLVGCSTISLDSKECPECTNALSEVACMEDSIRAQKLKQRQNHEKLALGKSIPLSLDSRYYLLPSTWLTKWRNYISTSGKIAASSVEPEILDDVVNSLKCEKHSQLLERPPDLVCKRGSIYQKGYMTDGLTIVTENDWKCFCEDWGGIEKNGISVIVEFSNTAGHDLVRFSKEATMSEGPFGPHDEENYEIESQRPVLRTCPEICEDCIGEKESCELMQKLNYCDEDIYVCLVRGKEAPRSISEATESMFEPDRRSSKRSRKTRSFINLKVSASTSIYQLKMMIWESLGVVKENQILHKGQRIIEQECATLADVNIFPGDKLWVQDSEIHEHRDIADELSDQKMNVQHSEEGFRGTLLTSNLSSQVV